MLTLSKKGGITKIIVWIVILLVIIGAIYMTYKYIQGDNSSQNNDNSKEDNTPEDTQTNTNVNTPTSDTDKPPRPPE